MRKKLFDDCMHALLSDSGLKSAGGGKILKYQDDLGFGYVLHDQPYNREEVFLDLSPSANLKKSGWIVSFPGEWDNEAEQAYNNFTSNPQNGF